MKGSSVKSKKTLKPGTNSIALLQRKEKVVAKAVTALAPFMIDESHGSTITDVDGNEYLDFTGGWGCLVVGHSHPKVVKAIQAQAAKFVHTDFSVVMYESYVELAERLVKYAPGKHAKKVAFFNSGAESVENAVKIARYHTKRRAIVVFDRAFHGRTLLTMTMTHKATPYKAHFGPFAPDVYRVPFPNPYHEPLTFAEWERKLTGLVNPQEIAGIVFEPIQGEGGFYTPMPDFLPKLREFCTKNGIVMIADEVQSGVGRTGKFFASEHFGIEPDLICTAKSLASGLPLSGVIGISDVIDSVADSGIGGTYVGNPIACAAANAVLDVIEEEKLMDQAQKLGSMLDKRFNEFKSQYKLVGDARGMGAMRAIELVKDRTTKEPASEATLKIIHDALDQGLILAKAGLYGHVIRMLIPLVMTEEELKQGLTILEGLISEASN
ncbi:4-aminobutyrate--2-oxoglutarate transaminase [Candidatus Acetothermia bacterium]|nr:4-aminobutyrate--2-oxoglutarate transaminase [Candidatus Acetothermia bacterium]MBI3642753.1 4-aminobutyrate--2-oxoglutarate transaminase [Candidatus Acetothermia bacterium]